jgi:tetratricopeptide (TPR) repeat protein
MTFKVRFGGFMLRKILAGTFFLAAVVWLVPRASAQIGKFVPIPANSEADHALAEINAATDAAQKLALIDKFAAGPGSQGDMAIVADDLYVNYYVANKNYEKAFEYGDKLFALDPDNFQNAVNLVHAAAEKGDATKLFAYGEKASGILQRFKAAPAPEGAKPETWEDQKKQTLESVADSSRYVEQLLYDGAYRTQAAVKRAALLAQFAQLFPESQYAAPALGIAAASYREAQNGPKMLETANALLAKDPSNVAMMILLADYYSEKGEQLDKAEANAKMAVAALGSAKKPEGVTDEQWQTQTALQKGLALSALGQVNIIKRDNVQAVDNLKTAAPLLKADAGSYARNQYRLGFALLNLKKTPEAKAAFTEAASVNSPYKALAQDKLKTLPATTAGRAKP